MKTETVKTNVVDVVPKKGNITVGRNLAAAFKRAQEQRSDVSVESLTKETGITFNTWYRWLRGKREPKCNDLARAALFLGSDPNSILLASSIDAPSIRNLDEEDLQKLVRIGTILAKLNPYFPNRRPADIFIAHGDKLVEAFAGKPIPRHPIRPVITADVDAKVAAFGEGNVELRK